MTEPFPKFAPMSTNWDGYDVPALWAMVESEQDWANREQVQAWMRMHDLLVSHQENLQRIRKAVADRWPPEGSGAARQVLARLDDLVSAAQTGSYAARSNASALSLLTDSLLEAKADIEPLHAQWQTAPPNQREGLNRQARAIMAQTDKRVAEHGNQFQAPPDVGPLSDEHWRPDPAQPEKSSTPARQLMVPPLEDAPERRSSSISATQGGGPGSSGPPRGLTSSSDPGPGVGPEPALTSTPPRQSIAREPAQDAATATAPIATHEASLDNVNPVMGRVKGLPTSPYDYANPRSNITDEGADLRTRGVPPVQGRQTLTYSGQPTQEGVWSAGGLIGAGLGGTRATGSNTIRNDYPADEVWQQPAGVAPIIKPDPVPDPKKAFDPGPNVIGGRR